MRPQPPHPIVQAVRAELAVPGRYHLMAPAVHRSLAAQVLAWLSAHWDAFWRAIAQRFGAHGSTLTLIGDVMVVVFGLVIVAAIVQFVLRLEIEAAARSGAVPLSVPRDAQRHAVAAAQAAAAGDYTRAVRLLFIAAVTLLDLRGVVRDERSATINDLRREVTQRGAGLEAPFLDLARAYTSAAYAEQPLDLQTWERAQAAYARLKDQAPA